ncbi:Sec-independent protein translocase protein TatA [compost metagenome]
MGIGGLSVGKLAILLLIVLFLFGGKRLRNVGSDVGDAVKGLREGLRSSDD